MSIIEMLLKELDQESVTTRKMLERVPLEKGDWQPHEKSMTLQRLAVHVAELPGWVDMALNTDGLDFQHNPFNPPPITNTKELLAFYDGELAKGRAALEKATEDQLTPIWTLRSGDQIFSQQPKIDVIRMSYSQTIHHRAQLGVFLRLLNVPIPGSYGPSADEQHM